MTDWSEEDLKKIIYQIYKDFCSHVEDKLGLEPEVTLKAGVIGCKVFEAEFRLFGPISYTTSLMLPLRNAFYRRDTMLPAWEHLLKSKPLIPPILDYGCGMGFTLAFLSQVLEGQPELYGYEPVGLQWGLMKAMGEIYGFTPWENQEVNTVIATNFLEHMESPLATLGMLYDICDNVLANVDLTDQEDHLAPMEERLACIEILRARGGLLEFPGAGE